MNLVLRTYHICTFISSKLSLEKWNGQNKKKAKEQQEQQQMQIGCQGQIIYTILYNFFYTRKTKEKTSNCNELNGNRNKYLWLRLNI